MTPKPKRKLTDRERADAYILSLWGTNYLLTIEASRAHQGYLAGLRAGRRERK